MSRQTLKEECSDQCEKATLVSTFPAMYSGDTVSLQTVDPSSGATTCLTDIVNDDSAGLWFEFKGSGSCISASAFGRDMNVVLALYTGGCDNLQCTDARNEALATADVTTELLFFGEPGQRYRLLVSSGYVANGNLQVNITVRTLKKRWRRDAIISFSNQMSPQ